MSLGLAPRASGDQGGCDPDHWPGHLAGSAIRRQRHADAGGHGTVLFGPRRARDPASGRGTVRTDAELARQVLLTSGGLTACLRRLETAGLISRRSVPEDRRRLLARLTDAGYDLIESFVDQRFAAANQALAVLDRQQKADLEAMLRQLISEPVGPRGSSGSSPGQVWLKRHRGALSR
ncbi:MarR family winged helix-turn-helix transcriptional regulator [Brevundimonas sp. GCM10030266]|uniref:MarR family winged helix-turn-helix transcriptional regulator n=1 Tax=Brevundimonas sp. GCM10030266 TaxID=3273386 RepID=UPI00361E0AB1